MVKQQKAPEAKKENKTKESEPFTQPVNENYAINKNYDNQVKRITYFIHASLRCRSDNRGRDITDRGVH